ncbi:MAG TPA: TetR/AcrR family transcriptional regulator [Phycisphaerales bacterium]|nr:TetR/AcrR family transcriptional regulator [Phycisphaerales bacterium]
MQRPDDAKRKQIVEAAAKLFATRPFHEVKLEEVAESAKVGKGTLYTYFRGKDELFLALIREGFTELLERTRRDTAADRPAWARLRTVVSGLIEYASTYPDLFRVMRRGALTADDAGLRETRRMHSELIEGVVRDGVAAGEMEDPHPELTAQFVLSFVRGALMYPPEGMTTQMLEEHIMRIFERGIGRGRG